MLSRNVFAVSLLAAVSMVSFAAPAIESKPIDDDQSWIVVLDEPPLAGYLGGLPGLPATSPGVTGKALRQQGDARDAYEKYLEAEQKAFLDLAARELGGLPEPSHRYHVALNGLALEGLTAAEAARIADLPGVRAVAANEVLELSGDATPGWIGADDVWTGIATEPLEGSQGEGVIVGVIDAGINYGHPAFSEIGEDGYRHVNPWGPGVYAGACDPGHPSFDPTVSCTPKLIGLWNYTDGPGDTIGHGTAVAGAAVGNHTRATIIGPGIEFRRRISGVAPHASLIAYDVCTSGCPTVFVLAGIDQAVADGVDVIVIAMASFPQDPWMHPLSLGLLGAVQADIVVVTTSGNTGPAPGTITSPGVAPWVTTAAHATHDRQVAKLLDDFDGGAWPEPPQPVRGAGLTGGYGPAPFVHAGWYGDPGCLAPFPAGTWSGEIVLCDRGSISRVAKGANVLAGGAGGLVLGNLPAHGTDIHNDTHFLPAIHVDAGSGEDLRDWLTTGADHRASIGPAVINQDDGFGDWLHDRAGRGPNAGAPAILKPDVVAPGTGIITPWWESDSYRLTSGSSMAAGHTAGLAALLVGIYPDASPSQITCALQTSALDIPAAGNKGVESRTPFEQGWGRVDARAAARTRLYFPIAAGDWDEADPNGGGKPERLNLPSLVSENCSPECRWQREVAPAGTLGLEIAWHVDVSKKVPGGRLSIEPDEFELNNPRDRVTLNFRLDMEEPLPSAPEWRFGEVLLTPQVRGLPPVRIPVAVEVRGDGLFEDGFETRVTVRFEDPDL